ncbi:MAG: hypothetical protein R2703_02925 [Micropruina glycogenica]
MPRASCPGHSHVRDVVTSAAFDPTTASTAVRGLVEVVDRRDSV